MKPVLSKDIPRVVVVQPPLLLDRDFIDYPYFSILGAVQAAAVLRGQGLVVDVLDGMSGPGSDLTPLGEREAWLGVPELTFLQRIAGLEGAAVVINASPFLMGQPGRTWLKRLMEATARARPVMVALAEMYVGGMHYLETEPHRWVGELAGAPLLLRHEGEALLARLSAAIKEGQYHPGEIWDDPEPGSLEELPAPAWDLLDMEATFNLFQHALGSPWRPGPIPQTPPRTLPLVTARGCPFACVFCTSNPGMKQPGAVRLVSMERVESWVDGWVEALDVQRLVLLDEVPNLKRSRFNRLLTMVEERGLGLELPNGVRADRLDREQVRRLARLCASLKVSLESASPRVQKEVLGKDLDPATVTRVAGWCQQENLPLQVHCMVGIPGERRQEITATLQVAAHLHETYGAEILLQNATPLPGTALHRLCLLEGLLEGDAERPWAGFQRRGLIRTPEFDPELLSQARRSLQRRLAADSAPPRKVIVNLTYRCNNHCSFCAVADREARDARSEAVIAQLRRHREQGCELLDLDGGEPTLHDDLFTIIRAGRQMGYGRIALITNGRRLSYPPFARELARSGVHEVLVSLHAAEEQLNQRITGAAGAFQQTVAGLTHILEAMGDADRVAVNTTVTAQNLEGLNRLGLMLARLGARRWNLQLVTPFGRANRSLLPDEVTLTTQLKALLDHPPAGLRIRLVNCPPCLVPGHEDAAAADLGKAQRSMVFVDACGENLQDYLSERREHTARCEGCVHRLNCPGEYRFNH